MEEYYSIDLSSPPEDLPSKWCSVKLIRKMSKIEEWQIFFDSESVLIKICHGVLNGKIQTETRKVVAKSTRNIQEQALQETRKRFTDKIYQGYCPEGSTVQKFSVMLAKSYDKVRYPFKYPVLCEAKLDGIRMYCYLDNGEVKVKSRTNRDSYPHIAEIKRELAILLSSLPRGAILDGELYSPELSFREITSAVRTVKTVHQDIDRLEYHIFDMWHPDNLPLEKRRITYLRAIRNYRKKLLLSSLKRLAYQVILRHQIKHPRTSKIIPINEDRKLNRELSFYRPRSLLGRTRIFITETKIARQQDELMKIHRYFTERNYEGTMIKRLANQAKPGSKDYQLSLYRQGGRGDNITKMKDVFDEEGICIGVKDATGREKGAAILQIRDPRGNHFTIRMKGPIEDRRAWLHDPTSIIGKRITYAYQTLSDYGVPLFPRGVAVRDYE